MRSLSILALLASATLLGGCSSSETPPAAPSDAGASADTGVLSPDASDAGGDTADAYVCHVTQTVQGDACSACLDTKCCAATEACLLSTPCKALDDCLNECLTTGGGDGGIADCAQACVSQEPADAQQSWRAYNDCLVASCDVDGAGPCQ